MLQESYDLLRKLKRLTVVRVDDLEVFHRGLRHSAVEVQHVRLSLFVKVGELVHQGHQLLRVAVSVAGQQSLELLKRKVKTVKL